MKRFSTIILFLALAIAGRGQVPAPIPEGYEKAFRRMERKIDRIERRESPDVILDPIESVPIEPTFYAMETGNWGPTVMGVNQRIDDIRRRASRPVVVFIFDTGGCYSHPFLKDVAWNELGRVFTGESSCEDRHGHSTHVAGIVAASAPDYPLGIARMLPDIKLVPVKVLNNSGSGSFSWITAGTRYATGEARKLIAAGWFVVYNYSLGGAAASEALEDAFREAEALGVLINVAANGNTGGQPIQYPGRSQYTAGTAALQQDGGGVARASYSSYGPETWCAAPGSSILSTWPGGGTRLLSGTSMAAPHQAGLFAILAAVYPTATAEDIRAHFEKHAMDLGAPGKDQYYGHGMGLAGPLLDNPIGGGPEPPTCDDGKKNGDETGIDCGGPCPPCETGPPPYKKRTLPVYLRGDWSLSWWRAEKKAPPELEPKVFDLDETAMVSPAGQKTIHVKEIGFEVEMSSEFDYEQAALLATVNAALNNTGLGTGDVDMWDAAKWVTLVVEYWGKTKPGLRPQNLRPLHLVAVVDGVEMRFPASALVDYKK